MAYRGLAVLSALVVSVCDGATHSSAHRCCVGQNFTFGLMPFDSPPFYTFSDTTGQFSGFVPQALDQIAEETGMNLTILPMNFTTMRALGYYFGLQTGTFDGILSIDEMDETFLPETNLSISVPFMKTVHTGIVRKSSTPKSFFAFVEPFTGTLWAAIMVFTVLSTMLMLAFSALAKDTSAPGSDAKPSAFSLTKELGTTAATFYHSWAMLLGGEDYEFPTWPSRMFRLGMLFFVVIITSTYTANLASFFTKSSIAFHGPLDMADLQSARACNPWNDGKQESMFGQFTEGLLIPTIEENELLVDFEMRAAWCAERVREGSADVWLDYQMVAHTHVLQNCEDLYEVRAIALVPINMGIAMSLQSPRARELIPRFNAAITWMDRYSAAFASLNQQYFGVGVDCPSAQTSDTTALTVSDMAGVFIVFGAVTILALVAAFIEHRGHFTGDKGEGELDDAATEGDMLRALLQKHDDLAGHNARMSSFIEELQAAHKSALLQGHHTVTATGRGAGQVGVVSHPNEALQSSNGNGSNGASSNGAVLHEGVVVAPLGGKDTFLQASSPQRLNSARLKPLVQNLVQNPHSGHTHSP